MRSEPVVLPSDGRTTTTSLSTLWSLTSIRNTILPYYHWPDDHVALWHGLFFVVLPLNEHMAHWDLLPLNFITSQVNEPFRELLHGVCIFVKQKHIPGSHCLILFHWWSSDGCMRQCPGVLYVSVFVFANGIILAHCMRSCALTSSSLSSHDNTSE